MDETDQRDHYSDSGITTSFSQLLFSDINESDVFCSDLGPKMLCFDGGFNDSPVCNSSSSSVITAAGAVTSAAGGNSNANVTGGKPNRRRNGSNGAIVKASSSAQRSCKKIKMESPCNSTGQPKPRKEKLGERIAVLQQLVSPFGKTDTASVLHEAMGYIRFLHDQLQVLCSPYLKQSEGKENGVEEPKELRSRGLCLVPVECTLHVASSNGADYWSPAMSATRQ